MKKWKILDSTYLIQTPYMNLRRDRVELPDGAIVPDYHVVEEGDYGVVFALTPALEVVMVRQYKHGIGEVTLELPAGYIDPKDANVAEGCWREFREETGYNAPSYRLVGNHLRHPTRHNNRGHLVIATEAYPDTAQNLDPAEAIDVLRVPIHEALDRVQSGEIVAVGTIASLYFGWDYVQRHKLITPR